MATHRLAHAFLVRQNRMLALQTADGSGWWGQPGGSIEPGESPADAVLRETREETGLDIEAPELLREWRYHDRRGDVVECYSFAARAPQGDVILSDEHTAYAWMPASEYIEKACSEELGAASPEWVRLFLAEMRENCTLFARWLGRRGATSDASAGSA